MYHWELVNDSLGPWPSGAGARGRADLRPSFLSNLSPLRPPGSFLLSPSPPQPVQRLNFGAQDKAFWCALPQQLGA